MKTAFDFFHAATRSGVSLYRELAVSAYQLVPHAQRELRRRRAERPQHSGYPLDARLTSESRLA